MTGRGDADVIRIMVLKANDKLHIAKDLFNLEHYELDNPIDKERAEENLKNTDEILRAGKEYLSGKYRVEKGFWE